jgi:hypothetical protein
MILIVQQIQTYWTKASRGAPAAVRRNAVPEALPVPAPGAHWPGPAPSRLHHKLWFSESKDFRTPAEEVILDPVFNPLPVGCVSILHRDEVVWTEFRYDGQFAGQPDRGVLRKKIRTGPNEWAQVAYNGRFTHGYDGYQWYVKLVVNVGVFSEFAADVFTRAKPTAVFRSMGPLI